MSVMIELMTFSLYIRVFAVSPIKPINIVNHMSGQRLTRLFVLLFISLKQNTGFVCLFHFFRPFMTFSLTLVINQEGMRLLSLNKRYWSQVHWVLMNLMFLRFQENILKWLSCVTLRTVFIGKASPWCNNKTLKKMNPLKLTLQRGSECFSENVWDF